MPSQDVISSLFSLCKQSDNLAHFLLRPGAILYTLFYDVATYIGKQCISIFTKKDDYITLYYRVICVMRGMQEQFFAVILSTVSDESNGGDAWLFWETKTGM